MPLDLHIQDETAALRLQPYFQGFSSLYPQNLPVESVFFSKAQICLLIMAVPMTHDLLGSYYLRLDFENLPLDTWNTLQALEARKTAKLPRIYYDWDDQLKTNASGNTQYTPINQTLWGLRASLDLLAAEGFDNVVKRHHRFALQLQSIA